MYLIISIRLAQAHAPLVLVHLAVATDCRGAESTVEFDRQWNKTVNAILAMNADIYGLAELENDGYGPTSAIQDLVNKLNASAGAGTYAFIDADALVGLPDALGNDAIKVGIIYKPANVTPIGTTAALNTVAFVTVVMLFHATVFLSFKHLKIKTLQQCSW